MDRQPPILVGDTRPFEHQLVVGAHAMRTANTKRSEREGTRD